MSEKDPLLKTKIKHKGIFNFKETYNLVYDWLINEGYDLNEKQYKENVLPGGAKEIEIEWEAMRKVSDYFQFVIKVEYHIMGMTEVEVEIDGKKEKMNRGQFEFIIKSVLVKDHESRWENAPFFKFLRTLYDRYLIPSRIENYQGKLIGEVDEIVAQVKSFLNLQGKR